MAKENIKKVAISIPNEGHTLPESYDNHLVMSFRLGQWAEVIKREKRNPQYQFNWFTARRLLTPFAREQLVEHAIAGGMDYILMYDDDMVLPMDMVQRMLLDMEENPEVDVLAPLAFMRNPPHLAVMYTTTEGYDATYKQPYYINQIVKKYPKDTLVECDAVGFGAVLIKMDVIKKMKPPYFFSTTGTGEDIYFCYKAKKEANARIFMDTRIKLGHLKNPDIVDEEYHEKWVKENGYEKPDIPHKYLNEL